MQHLSDEQLVGELKFRLEQSRKSLYDLSVVNHKLVDMNRRLEASESLKSNFLSNIRNEINNPLNAIIGLAGQLATIVRKPEVTELVGLLFLEALNLDFQLRNIFIAAELEAGELSPDIEHVEVNSVVSGVLESFSAYAAAKQVSLCAAPLETTSNGVLFFPTDAQMLQVVIANLVANAIEFSRAGGEVIIAVKQLEAGLQVQVQDHGVGVDEADLKRIFDRFVQLDTGPTRAHHGHGLGLSIVRSLLDLLHGEIQVQSTPGVGSLFSITVPAASYASEESITFAEGGNLFLFDQMDEK